MKKIGFVIVAAIVLYMSFVGWVGAWPDQPPAKATISGPGLKGPVQITDPEALRALKLGALEDFDAGAIAQPSVGEGYTITRWFEDGQFNFGLLHYYPGTQGQPAYVYFQDGPDIRGDHTPYHLKWFHATSAGDEAMKGLLTKLGAGSSKSERPNTSNAGANTANVPAQGLPDVLRNPTVIAVLLVTGAFGLVLAAGTFMARRRGSMG